jgi:hypothetical protein
MSSIRSASSRTTYSTWFRTQFFASMWSSRRPGVADEHLDALLQLERLRLHVDAAEDDGDAQLRVRRVALDVVGDLVGELARRRDDEGAHRVARRRHAGGLVRQHLVQERQRERRRLAGAGLRRAHDVAPGEDDRDRLRLDRRHRRVALVGDGALQDRREADRGELEGGSVGVGAGKRGRGRLARKRVQRAVRFIHDAIIAPRPGERWKRPWPVAVRKAADTLRVQPLNTSAASSPGLRT